MLSDNHRQSDLVCGGFSLLSYFGQEFRGFPDDHTDMRSAGEIRGGLDTTFS